nr:hypothetical protein BaRGS_026655 [Batillaria attramentaria]
MCVIHVSVRVGFSSRRFEPIHEIGYLLLIKLSPSFHFLEAIILLWVLTIFVEELRQFFARLLYCFSINKELGPKVVMIRRMYMVPIMMAVYVLVTNVLLLNLLIAMFSYTFQKVQDNTDIHWHFQRFNLIFEYSARPCLPPPLIIFSYIRMAVDKGRKKWYSSQVMGSEAGAIFIMHDDGDEDDDRVFEEKKNKELVRWEDIMIVFQQIV